MSDPGTMARNRYFAMIVVRIAAAAGAVFGLVIVVRSPDLPRQLLGGALLLSALYVMAMVPRALAHRWRTPDA